MRRCPGAPRRCRCRTAHYVNGAPIEAPFPAGLEQALFGMGCFWGAEKVLAAAGVYTTAVGYAAGYTPNPTYREVCSGMTGHNEVVLVVFDPQKVSYDELLKMFWESHDPTQGMRQGNDVGTQYRSGHLLLRRRAARGGRALARAFQRSCSARRLRHDHDGDLPARSSTTPRTITSSTSRRIPADTAASVALA